MIGAIGYMKKDNGRRYKACVQYVVVNNKGDLSIRYSSNPQKYGKWYYTRVPYKLNKLKIGQKKFLSAVIYERLLAVNARLDEVRDSELLSHFVEEWAEEYGIEIEPE